MTLQLSADVVVAPALPRPPCVERSEHGVGGGQNGGGPLGVSDRRGISRQLELRDVGHPPTVPSAPTGAEQPPERKPATKRDRAMTTRTDLAIPTANTNRPRSNARTS